MKQREFRSWLESRGVRVVDGSKHLKLSYRGRQSVMPRHPAREMHEQLRRSILRQLGVE